MLPGSMTVGEAKQRMLNSSIMDDVLGLIKIGRFVRVRFMIGEEEVQDSMTLGEWRVRGGRIVIDDEGGGTPARVPETVV